MSSFLKIAVSMALKVLLFPLTLFKIKKKRLIFTGLTGGTAYEYSCNLKYLSEYIQEQWPGYFEICWVVKQPEKYTDVSRRQDICFLKHYSLRSFYYLMTAQVIVSGGSYAPWFPFRKKQYFINTWHGGGAYKRVENGRPDAGWASRKRAEFCAGNIDLFLSSCKQATEQLFRGTFGYHGEVMEAGMPRNDKIVKGDTEAAAQKVRDYYEISADERIVLFAPTYRESGSNISLDGQDLLKVLSGDGDRWRLLYRMHRYQNNGTDPETSEDTVISANNYPDMQELLCAADMLITDYSSAIWDYSFLYRPCFLFTPDLDEYLKRTGFYVDIHDWPFPIAETQEELYECIHNYDPEKSCDEIKKHHHFMGSYETGQACEYAAKRISDVCKEN